MLQPAQLPPQELLPFTFLTISKMIIPTVSATIEHRIIIAAGLIFNTSILF